MTLAQLNQLGVELEKLNYPHSVNASILEGTYHLIKCRQEKILPEVCKLLMEAPDFDGIMIWGPRNQPCIVFTYQAH